MARNYHNFDHLHLDFYLRLAKVFDHAELRGLKFLDQDHTYDTLIIRVDTNSRGSSIQFIIHFGLLGSIDWMALPLE